MAKFNIKFLDFYCSDSISVEKISNSYFDNEEDKTEFLIKITSIVEDKEVSMCLDKSTAIKFAKTLRTEINKITESEVCNG